MSFQENVLGFVDPRGERGRAPGIGMNLLDERTMRGADPHPPRPQSRPRIS